MFRYWRQEKCLEVVFLTWIYGLVYFYISSFYFHFIGYNICFLVLILEAFSTFDVRNIVIYAKKSVRIFFYMINVLYFWRRNVFIFCFLYVFYVCLFIPMNMHHFVVMNVDMVIVSFTSCSSNDKQFLCTCVCFHFKVTSCSRTRLIGHPGTQVKPQWLHFVIMTSFVNIS